jgi:hypothetical protein
VHPPLQDVQFCLAHDPREPCDITHTYSTFAGRALVSLRIAAVLSAASSPP